MGNMPVMSTMVVLVGSAVSLLIVLYALTRGDPHVRAAAVAIGLNALLSPIVQNRLKWIDPSHRLLILDAACTLALMAVAVRRPRDWVIAAAAWQLLATVCDALAPIDATISAGVWLRIMMAYSWAAQLCLLWGAVTRPDAYQRADRDEATA